MSDTRRNHTEPKRFRKARPKTDKTKPHKQRRPNEKAALRKEFMR